MLFYYRSFAYYFYLGSSFAYSYEITSEDAATLANHFVPYNDNKAVEWRNNVISILTYWGSQKDTVLVSFSQSNNHIEFKFLALDKIQITNVENLNNINYMSVTYTGTAIFRRQTYNGANYAVQQESNNAYSLSPYTLGNGAQTNTQYILYNNDLTDNIDGPYQSSNILTFIPPEVFEILLNVDENTQYISIIDSNDIEIDNIAVLDSSFIGTLNDDFDYPILADSLTIWYYNNGEWNEKRLYNRPDRSDDILYNNSYLSFSSQDTVDTELTNIYIKDLYKYYNVVYVFNVTNTNFDTAQARFMFKNSNTVINNGSVDTSNFGSDYNNQFDNLDNMINNNNNTQEIIDNVNDDSEVDNILDSISSGDDIESLANNLGIVTIENPFTDIVFGIFNGAIDSLTSSGDVSLNFGFHGQDIYINSSDFSTPSNIITQFIGLILDALFIYALYWYYFMIIESIKNFTFYQDIVNDKKWVVSSSESGGLNWRLL